ncbi:hypothetical protein ALT1644_720002 [Alteromonas macleodii]
MSSVIMLVFVDYSLIIMNSAYLTHSAVVTFSSVYARGPITVKLLPS